MDDELIHQSLNRARALAKKLGLEMNGLFTEREEELKGRRGRDGNKTIA